MREILNWAVPVICILLAFLFGYSTGHADGRRKERKMNGITPFLRSVADNLIGYYRSQNPRDDIHNGWYTRDEMVTVLVIAMADIGATLYPPPLEVDDEQK